MASLESRLAITTLPLQLASADGAIDLVNMELLQYTVPSSASAGGSGSSKRGAALDLERVALLFSDAAADGGIGTAATAAIDSASDCAELAAKGQAARELLVERVAELEPDGDVAELYLSEEFVPPPVLKAALRRLTLSRSAVPTICGASLRGVGVE